MLVKEIIENISGWFSRAYNSFINYFKEHFNKKEEKALPKPDIKIVKVKVTGVKIKKKKTD